MWPHLMSKIMLANAWPMADLDAVEQFPSAIEEVGSVCRKQTQDLVSAAHQERAAQPSRPVVDELANFELVVRHGSGEPLCRLDLPGLLLVHASWAHAR